MTEGRGPEEFFEVFRSVQSGRKKRDEKPASGGPATDEPETEAVAPTAGAEPRPSPSPRVWERELAVSFPVAVLVVLSALLVALAAYLLGRQQGWQNHAAAQAAKGSVAAHGNAPTSAAPAATLLSGEPECNAEGKVFTIVMYGPTAKNRERAEQEAKYLNGYPLFTRTLKVQAYVWSDKQKRYRLCVRGLNALSADERENVKKEIRKLKSSTGKADYHLADFQTP